jgi:hypothetical protein
VSDKITPSPASASGVTLEVTGDTSDGYHTFTELYAYRKAYNAILFNEWARLGLNDVHKSWRHSDGEPCFGGGWFIVVAQTPAGQISNHYEAPDWELFQVAERDRGEWDGHTPSIALGRLLSLAALPGLRALSALPAASQVTELQAVKDALDAAWQDLHEWRRLAEEQRKAHPDPNHAPQIPSQAGIDKTKWILNALMPPAFLQLEALASQIAVSRETEK